MQDNNKVEEKEVTPEQQVDQQAEQQTEPKILEVITEKETVVEDGEVYEHEITTTIKERVEKKMTPEEEAKALVKVKNFIRDAIAAALLKAEERWLRYPAVKEAVKVETGIDFDELITGVLADMKEHERMVIHQKKSIVDSKTGERVTAPVIMHLRILGRGEGEMSRWMAKVEKRFYPSINEKQAKPKNEVENLKNFIEKEKISVEGIKEFLQDSVKEEIEKEGE